MHKINHLNFRGFIATMVKAQQPPYLIREICHKSYGRNTYSDNYINQLIREFSLGKRNNTDKCAVSGRPQTATDEIHKDMLFRLMRESRTWTTGELANEMNISVGSTHNLLHEMEFRKVGPKWLPHELNCTQKQERVRICQESLNRIRNDPSIRERIIAIDET
jgi:hypothetical protein